MAEAQVSTKSPPKQRPASAKPKKTDKAIQAQPDLVQTKEAPTLFSPTQQSGVPNGVNSGLWSRSIQTKLKVGQPGDRYEQEADAVADKVVQTRFEQSVPEASSSSTGLQTKPEEEPEVQAQAAEEPDVQTMAEEEPEVQTQLEEEPQVQAMAEEEPDVQTQPDEEPEVQTMSEDEPEVQTQSEEEPEIQAQAEEEPEVQAMAEEEPDVQTQSEDEPAVKAKDGDGQTSDSFDSQLSASSHGGAPLAQSTISQVQPHLGADLSSVRVHTDSNAVQMNQQLGSQAFTHKNHVYFNEGKYNPGTTSGDHLIAHELTHTVQQGAAVKTKTEEEPEEEIQTKVEAPELQKQIDDAPTDGTDAPPAAPAANADTNGDSTDNNDAGTPPPPAPADNGGNTGDSGSSAPPTDNKANSDASTATLEPQEKDLNQDNPITEREAVKAEEGQAVEKLGLEGSSEDAMAAFTSAGASAIAATLPGLGDTMSQKLGAEKQKEADEAPVLTAGTTGVQDPKAKPVNGIGASKNADLKDGATEGEPNAPQLEPHKEGRPLPKYRKDDKLDDGKPQAAESGGFFSWLFDKFKDVMGGVSTRDGGMNTSAGARPKIDTTGKANPQRTDNQAQEGKEQVNQEKDKAAEEINKNPGQENIQPEFFEEPNTIQLNTELSAQVISEQDQNIAEFAKLSLPEEVRTQADLDLAPALDKSLVQPREQTKQAAMKRDSDKQKAIDDSKAQVEQLNKDAEQQQQQVVAENRQAVADEQKRGIEEANTQMNAFSTEADKEKNKANKEAKERIKKDQSDADKQLKQAEADAEKERKKGEEQARAEKEKAKKDSGEKSWWGKFKDVVSSAVSWLTEKIGEIFSAIRKAVTELIDKAKKAALDLIEAGRKWIVEKLDQFGNWLKEKANKYLAAFPALRDKVNGFIDKTVNAAKDAVNKIADGLKKGVAALADALKNGINAVLNAFETALTAAVQFAGAMLKGDFAEALKIAFMATCKIAGIDPNPVLNFINKAGETISMIFKDPAAFFGNVASGVKMGLDQFIANIKKHLISGLIGWLTGAMSDVPIEMPEKFDLKGIFSLVMQILGLTYQRIRAKVVKKIGPKGEQIVSAMETGFQFVKDFITKGPIVLYERIQDKFTEIKEMAMEKIRNLVTIEVVKAGIKWLIGLLNPASAIVKAVLMLYDFVMFLIDRKDQIIGFVTAVFDTVGPLARGQVKNAANAVEGAMGRGVPVILGLLANLAGLGGIGKQVSKVIKTIQKPVDKVVDPIIGWLVKQGKKMWKTGKKGVKNLKDKAVAWWNSKKQFKDKDGKSHKVFFKNKQLTVASNPITLLDLISYRKPNAKLVTDKKDRDKLQVYLKNVERMKRENATGSAITDEMNKIADILTKYNLDAGDYHKPAGTKSDPIYINWYKDITDYPTVTLTEKGVTKTFSMSAPRTSSDGDGSHFHFKRTNLLKVGRRVKKVKSGDRSSKFTSWAHRFRKRTEDKTANYDIKDHPQANDRQTNSLHLGRKLKNSWELDHVRPLKVGGKDGTDNLWPLKQAFNSKANSIYHQWVYRKGKAVKIKSLPKNIWLKATKTISVSQDDGTSQTAPYMGNSADQAHIQSELAAGKQAKDIRTGRTKTDAIAIIWNKKSGDFPRINNKTIFSKIDLNDNITLKLDRENLNPKSPWKLTRSDSRGEEAKVRKALKAKTPGTNNQAHTITQGSTLLVSGRPMDTYVDFDHVTDLAFGGDDDWSNVWVMRADKNNLAKANSDQYVAVKGESKAVSLKSSKLNNKHMKIAKQMPAQAHGTSPDKPAGLEELTKIT